MESSEVLVVVMITAIDRPELHKNVFSKYLEYTKGVNCKWVITVNNVTNRIQQTVDNINDIFKGYDVHIKTFDTGGSYKDWHESVKYCINQAHDIDTKLGYLWLEDDWLLNSNYGLLDDIKLLDDDNCYISLHSREHVSFNPGIWSKGAFNELMYNSINNPETSIGKRNYSYYYIKQKQQNPERLCCPHPESTDFIKSFKSLSSRFKDVGRGWQQKTINTRTFDFKNDIQ
jgi:hypothetical protein